MTKPLGKPQDASKNTQKKSNLAEVECAVVQFLKKKLARKLIVDINITAKDRISIQIK